MEKEVIIEGKHIKFDVLDVKEKSGEISGEKIIAINATDIIHLPDLTEKVFGHINSKFPEMKTIYYRVSVNIIPVMEDTHQGFPGINVSPEDLKKYESTLESLKTKY